MDILLTDISALRAWRCPAFYQSTASHTPCRVSPSRWGADAEDVSVFMEQTPLLGDLQAPLHLLVPEPCRRRSSQAVVSHLCGTSLLRTPVYRVAPGVFVVSPALCLLQLAATHTPIAIAKLAYEFCGSYARNPDAEGGFDRRAPITSTAALRRFLDKVPPRVRGIRTLRKAVGFVGDNAASPMEATLGLHLALPAGEGGYGLPLPQFNREVHVPKHLVAAIGKRTLRCDLFYPDAQIDVEYDSNDYHTGLSVGEDSRRRAALELMGIQVNTVAWLQVKDIDALDAVARIVRTALGKRALPQLRDFRSRQLRLRSELLNFSREL